MLGLQQLTLGQQMTGDKHQIQGTHQQNDQTDRGEIKETEGR